jgi:hypothetical protein
MAQDGIPREPSDDPAVHRELVVVDPPLEGRDVANLQRAVMDRLDARPGLGKVPTPVHGKFTHASAVAAVEAQYFLGLLSGTYLKTEKVGGERRLLITEGAQTILRNPEHRTGEQLERARERMGQLDRGPRYYDDLARANGVSGGGKGAKAALEFAAKQLGVSERPPGSNWGPRIEGWIRAAGYGSPVPWCGCFANACIMAGGEPSGAGWIGYTPAIVARAKSGTGGWTWHSSGQPGDLVLFDTPGGDPAVHVGICERKINAATYATIEGNTSSGSGGSQSEGGGVYRRQRSTQGNFRIIGFARPSW